MRLLRVIIDNYRSIKELTLEMEPSCLILAGINESGKSNILKALSLLDPEAKCSPDDIRDSAPDDDPDAPSMVRFVFQLDRKERKQVFAAMRAETIGDVVATPIVKSSGLPLTLADYLDTRSEIVYEVDIRTGKKQWTYWSSSSAVAIAGTWQTPIPAASRTTAIVANGESRPLSGIRLISSGSANVAPESVTEMTVVGLDQWIASKTISSVAEKNVPSCVWWSYSEEQLLPGQIALASFAANPNICLPLLHMFELADITNVSEAIANAQRKTNGVTNLLKRVSDRSTRYLRKVWPEHTAIQLELLLNGSSITATVKDVHNSFDLGRRSDGFKRFVTFLLMIAATVESGTAGNILYLHDEPDIGLHPSAAEFLRDELLRVAKNGNYVVFSTHSIFMVDRHQIDRHMIVTKKKEVTSVVRVEESNIHDEEVIYRALGTSVFRNLRSRNLVFEGWRDKRLYEIATERVPQSHPELKDFAKQVGLFFGQGVKQLGSISKLLRSTGLQCAIVSDADQVAKEKRTQYLRDEDAVASWVCYDAAEGTEAVVTMEDYLRPAAFKAAIDELRLSVPGLEPIDIGGIPTDRLKAIDSWLSGVISGKDQRKELLNALKSRIVEDLHPKNIEPLYFDFLRHLARTVGVSTP